MVKLEYLMADSTPPKVGKMYRGALVSRGLFVLYSEKWPSWDQPANSGLYVKCRVGWFKSRFKSIDFLSKKSSDLNHTYFHIFQFILCCKASRM